LIASTYTICILLRQSFFRNSQCQIIYKFTEILQKKSFAISTTLSTTIPRQIVKKNFTERKREEKNTRVYVHCRVSRDITMHAWMRLLNRFFDYPRWLSSEGNLYPRTKLRKKLEFLNPNDNRITKYIQRVSCNLTI